MKVRVISALVGILLFIAVVYWAPQWVTLLAFSLLCALAAALVGILLFARPDIWRQILADFLAQPYKIALLVLSVPLVLWFILRGGARDKL